MGDHRTVLEGGGPSVVIKDVTKAVQSFARTARARPLYSANNKALEKMMDEVERTFDHIFGSGDEIVLKVTPDTFVYEDTAVFEEKNAENSVPFLFFRDGVRRLEFTRGVQRRELEILVDAIGFGMNRRGSLDDDVVSFLWRHELEHIRYVTVDTTIIDSTSDLTFDNSEMDVDMQIDALIQSIYGGYNGGEFNQAIHLDSSELDAKKLAEALGRVDELAPGFHPPRNFISEAAFAEDLRGQLVAETELSLRQLAANAAAEAFARRLPPTEMRSVADAMLRMFDAALMSEQIELARQIVGWVQQLGDEDPRVDGFLVEAMSDARLRQLATYIEGHPERHHEVLGFVRSAGAAAAPALVALLPSLNDPVQRRAFSDLALEVGLEDTEPIYLLLESEQGFVAAEALHMLAQLKALDRRAAREAIRHPKPQVRLGLLQLVPELDERVGEESVLELLTDPETRVRAEAVQLLPRFSSPRTRAAVEAMMDGDAFEDEGMAVKQAVMVAYIAVAGRHGFARLEEVIKSSDRRLTRKPQEEMGVAAVIGIASMPSSKSVEILKKACLSRNKKVRERARFELSKMRKDFE